MSYRIAVDTGGTFTDVVVADGDHNLFVNKALTDQDRVYAGIEEALRVTADQFGISLERLLGETSIVIYGTTRATNAIIEGTTAKTAFLTTNGFPDTLLLREGGKPNAYDFSIAYPKPYVPRRLTFEITERVDADGNVVTALDEDQARAVLRQVGAADVQAVGVSLLWSIANAAHEERMGELIGEELPGVPYTLSHRINPIIREYRRASATVIDASLKPLMQQHLRSLQADLAKAGFVGELFTATSFGGMMDIFDLVEQPIYATRSGPSMAPVAGKTYGAAELDAKDVVICDTGGTSFDVSMVRDSEVVFTRETWLGGRFLGHLTGLASVDARSIGAGGGSIAWVDPGGLLRVGPHSAGSEPGPAAYGKGGTMPTVTDAAVVLGYLNPQNFLGGRLALDVDAAKAAVGAVADQLGLDIEETAMAIMRVASEHMVEAVQEITVNEGVDPEECLVVAGGGAAGLNIGLVARELGARQLLVPRTAGALSACGAQFSDIVAEHTASRYALSSDFDYAAVNATLDDLDARLDELSKKLTARGVTEMRRSYSAEARYQHQNWELEVSLGSERFDGPDEVQRLVEAFHHAHERVFAIADPGSAVEVLQWKVRLTAVMDKPLITAHQASGTSTPAHRRRAYFAETGSGPVPCYDGPALAVGTAIAGPAVIEEPTTTLVVYPDMTVNVTSSKNYLMELER